VSQPALHPEDSSEGITPSNLAKAELPISITAMDNTEGSQLFGGYLDRIGIFEALGSDVAIVGLTPAGLAQTRRGQSHGLEEIVSIPAVGDMDRAADC
jgi:hypothetical protein